MQNREVLPVHQPLSKQVVGIDLLRLMAAVLVMLYHFGVITWLPSHNGGLPITHAFDRLHPYACYGWIGVEIFFVISGFVIAYSAQKVNARTFARHRLFRLYPMMAMCATVCLVALLFSRSRQWQGDSLLLAYLRTLVFWPIGHKSDEVFWTLSLEMVFYSLVFVVLALRRLQYLPLIMAVVGLLSTLYWTAVTASPMWSGALHNVVDRVLRKVSQYPWTLAMHGCYFALGVLLWECLLRRAQMRWVLAAVACTLGGLLEIHHTSAVNGTYMAVPVPWMNAAALWLFGVAIVIVATVWNRQVQQTIGPGGVRWFRTAGLMTYPLYLMHNRVGTEFTLRYMHLLGVRQALVIAVVLVLVLAYVLAMIVDPAVQRVLRNAFVREKPSAVAV